MNTHTEHAVRETPTEIGNPSGLAPATAGGSSPPNRRARRGLRKGVSIALAVLMLLATYVAVADAVATHPPTIVVSGMQSANIAVGQTAHISANITGGIPVSAVIGSSTGYLVFFFYGQTNATGALGFVEQVVAPPSGCSAADTVCAVPAPVSFSHVYDHSGSFDVSLTVYDAAGDYSIATDVVNVQPPTLKVDASSNVTTAAEDSPVLFTASTTTIPASFESDTFTYQWHFGDNTSAWGNPVAHAFPDAGNYAVTVRSFDNQSGAANQSAVVPVAVTNPAPQPGIQVLTPTLVANTFPEDTSVSFSAASSSDVPTDLSLLRYLWNFGDGTMSAGISASHVYTEAGSYAVSLSVVDEENLQASAHTTIVIQNTGPSASTAANYAGTVAVGTVAVLNASATTDVPTDLPLENYSWATHVAHVTDLGSSYGLDGREAYFVPGNYSANLTVSDEENAASSASTTVHVGDTPPNVGVYSMYAMANLTLNLQGNPGNTVNISVLENGLLVAGGSLTRASTPPSGNVLVLHNVRFALNDRDSVVIKYANAPGVALTGSNPATLTVLFWGDKAACAKTSPTYLCAQTYSHTFYSTKPATQSWTVSGNAAALGQVVFLAAQVFSPARTPLSTTWSFGDSSTALSSTPAPAGAQPTLGYVAAMHRWLPGHAYSFKLSTHDAYGGTNSSSITVTEIGAASVSDIAPAVTLSVPTASPAAPSTPLPVVLTSQNYSQASFNLYWHYGDGLGASQLGVGGSATGAHYFHYSSTSYAVVVYASDRSGGPATVNWTFLSIQNALPIPSFTVPSGAIPEFTSVAFDASASRDFVGASPGNLTYAWVLGDGSSPGVLRGSGVVLAHTFTREGTFAVTLTITDDEGLSAVLTQHVQVVDVPASAQLPNRTVTADEFTMFAPTGLTGGPTDVANMSGVWHWGDGAPNSLGLSAGHTYVRPGVYSESLSLYTEDGLVAVLIAQVTVLDQSLTVILPYNGFTVYGENHSVDFRATVLGSAADESSGPNAFTYHWTFGDGSPGLDFTGGLSAAAPHSYSLSGNPVLSVTVDGPNGTAGSASATLISVPNWDGDGIPDAYASLLLHLAPGNDASSGQGLTDFMSAFVVHGVSPSADTDGDGLTDFQEVFGTVTGYVTNPLDPNSAGDGLLDGSHQFFDSFASTQVVHFASSGSVLIPAVQHPGDAVAVRQVELYDEIVSPNLTALTVDLKPVGGGATVHLGTPGAAVGQYTLLNSTPTGGPQSNYSLSLPEFQTLSDWQLTVSGGPGTIESASIGISYYTNPNRADPYGSGLLLGQSFSIPLYNLSEPTDANYTVFNGQTFTYSTVDYYPFTQAYYKLSVVQGLPYAPWDNASYSPGTAGVLADPHAFATYYGDRDFGIGPWQTHFADPSLTDAMKAYGRVTYDLTANHYRDPGSGNYLASQQTPYPWDSLAYPGPLNPTAKSTGTNGVLDSLALAPTAGPRVLGVHLSQVESNPVSVFDFGADSNAGGVVQIKAASYPGTPSTYTKSASGSNNYGQPGGPTGDPDHVININWFYTFNDFYQLPVAPDAKNITIDLALYQNYSLGVGAVASTSMTFSADPSLGDHAYNQGGFQADFQVFTFARMPVVLLNSTNEVKTLPGYGELWKGDRHFYTLYVTLNDSGAGTPFAAGQNLLLVSRSAFVNSSLNHSMAAGDPGALPFLGGSELSDRGNSSARDILGSLSVTLNSSDANRLLSALIPHNGSGNVTGNYQALSQLQFELLGLDDQTMHAAPYLPLQGFNSEVGTPPESFWSALGAIIVSIADAIVSVILAVVNFIVNLANEIGQAIVGAWNAAAAAIASAVQAIASAFEFIIKWVEDQFTKLGNLLKGSVLQGIGKAIEAIALPILSFLVSMGGLSMAGFNDSYASLNAAFNLSDPSPLDNETSAQQFGTILAILMGIISGLFAIVGAIIYIIDIVSIGAAVGPLSSLNAFAGIIASSIVVAIFGVLSAVGSIFSVITQVVTIFNGTDAVSKFFEFLNNDTNANIDSTVINGIVTVIQGIADFIRVYILTAIDGLYIVGIALGVVSLIIGIFAAIFNQHPLAALVLSGVAFLLAAVAVVVQFYPLTQAANEASQTGFADAAGIVLGISAAILAISVLTTSALTCAQNTTKCLAD